MNCPRFGLARNTEREERVRKADGLVERARGLEAEGRREDARVLYSEAVVLYDQSGKGVLAEKYRQKARRSQLISA
jgi:hypothetical protein